MTDRPDDSLDPFEEPLARRVRHFSDRAVVAIDAAAVARAAVTTRRSTWRPSSGSGGRLGWILAAGLLVVAVAGVAVIGSGSRGLLPPTSVATPSTTPTSIRACTPDDVDAGILSWDGAAGSRIAAIELHNTAGVACTMWQESAPRLVDGGGATLIDAAGIGSSRATIEIGPSDTLSTLVQVSNYCGPTPDAPVTVAFRQDAAIFVATALSPTDLSGLPPCNGPGQPAQIQMQPWGR